MIRELRRDDVASVAELARTAGSSATELSVAMTNERAIRFYQRGGWSKLVENGAWKRGVMTKRLA